ncbi:MAG: TolC family outer membrane protein, partial [Pseudomonadota bacterium]
MRLGTALKRLVMAGAISLTPMASGAETLRDALRSAYQHSGLLEQNRALLRAADEDVAQAVATLRPVVSWVAQARIQHATDGVLTSSGASTVRSASATISADWLLYDFGRTELRVNALKETVLATRAQLIGVEQNVLFSAAAAFLNYRRAVDSESLRRNNVELIQEQLRAARDRFEVGEVTRTDVALAEARLASARAQLAQASGSRVQASAEFQRAVGRAPGRLQAPSGLPRLPGSVDAAMSVARRGHPDMIAIQHQINAAELSVQQTELSRRPNVSLNSSATLDSGGGGIIGQVGVTASGQIYSGGAMASQTRQAVARRDATRAGLHTTRHIIDQTVQNAYVSLTVARASMEATDRQIRASQVAFRGVREEASLGARTTLDVLDAEQELLNARTNRLSAGIDEQLAAYQVLAATGQMTATALNLGVKTYDPAEYYNLVSQAPRANSAQGQALDRVLQSIS